MRRCASSRLKQEVLAVLATALQALTPGQVGDQRAGDLAYTTVMTVLSRLHRKGAASRERAGRSYAYRWAADPLTLATRQMRQLLDREAVIGLLRTPRAASPQVVLTQRLPVCTDSRGCRTQPLVTGWPGAPNGLLTCPRTTLYPSR